jgi:hypothetical protein
MTLRSTGDGIDHVLCDYGQDIRTNNHQESILLSAFYKVGTKMTLRSTGDGIDHVLCDYGQDIRTNNHVKELMERGILRDQKFYHQFRYYFIECLKMRKITNFRTCPDITKQNFKPNLLIISTYLLYHDIVK